MSDTETDEFKTDRESAQDKAREARTAYQNASRDYDREAANRDQLKKDYGDKEPGPTDRGYSQWEDAQNSAAAAKEKRDDAGKALDKANQKLGQEILDERRSDRQQS
mgnify:CR=1 FL=1